jgi:hypothetical protein
MRTEDKRRRTGRGRSQVRSQGQVATFPWAAALTSACWFRRAPGVRHCPQLEPAGCQRRGRL